MRTVIIPTNMHPWSCEINGVKYGPYPAGTEQTVPDEVAAVIDNYYASLPKEDPPETDEEEITRIATPIAQTEAANAAAGVLPAVTGADNGKLLGVTEGAWGKVDAPKELPAVTADDNGKVLGVSNGAWGKVDNSVFVVNFTGTANLETGQVTNVTCDKSASEIHAAYEAGKVVLAHVAITEIGVLVSATWHFANASLANTTGVIYNGTYIFYCQIGYGLSGNLTGQVIPISIAGS